MEPVPNNLRDPTEIGGQAGDLVAPKRPSSALKRGEINNRQGGDCRTANDRLGLIQTGRVVAQTVWRTGRAEQTVIKHRPLIEKHADQMGPLGHLEPHERFPRKALRSHPQQVPPAPADCAAQLSAPKALSGST